ncbi:MAG: SGNH/GDSL hydrolase family protein [Chloroflexota bacterium]|nr:SGNH/GDSL hydrolase family protein [Chloroflexota bacterium]
MQPRVLLLGDSICSSPGYSFGSGGYAPLVTVRLRAQGIAVDYYRASGWTTRHFLELLAAGELRTGADIIHFNVGLHDIARHDEEGECAVPLEEYARNLQAIVERLRAGPPVELVWASTTPVLDERHRREKRFIRRDADVRDYNRAAAAVMRELHVAEHDLYQAVMRAGVEEAIGPDGVHPTEAGREVLAAAVSDLVAEKLGGR